jgi:signal transduction histidine kinase
MKNKKIFISGSVVLKLTLVLILLAIAVIILVYSFSGLIMSAKIDQKIHHYFLLILIALVIIAFIIASIAIHRYLNPIKLLTTAVNEIKNGNLDKKVSVKGHDEFSRLAEAFNAMTSELKNMILAREQLLLDVSHELRTPITRSRLALEMMPDSKEKLSVIDDLREMEVMVTDILETARLNNGTISLDLKDVKVYELINKAISSFENEKDRLLINPISDQLLIKVDEDRINTVLRNIIENSLKYSPADKRQIEISIIDRRDTVSILIEDFGHGIPEDKLPFVFEPFFRADDSRSKKTGGYGLGLHLCKRIMEAHGAEISIRNKPSAAGIVVSLGFKNNR